MEGVRIRNLLSYLEKVDKSLLILLSNFRIEERGKTIRLITEDPNAVNKMKKLLTLKTDNLPVPVEIVLEAEEESQQSKARAEGLSPKYSFNNFVVGEANKLAYEVCKEIAENPGNIYNPTFIYGDVGLGKTHLLQAIGNHCFLKGYTVVYKSAVDFSEEMVESIKNGKIHEFRNRYRNIDVLLLDDIQLLAGKNRTQEEFFNIFNYLYLKEKQIVLASDRSPRHLKDISERLISRFEGGVVVEIGLDDLTKIEIIKRKLKELKIDVQAKIIEFLMKNTSANVREIEGAVKKIKLVGVKDLKNIESKRGDIAIIINRVALYFGLKAEDITGNKKSKKITRARQIAMYLCRKLTYASLIEIARSFNRKDHSTVLHALRKVEEEKKADRKLNYIVSFLESHLREKV